MLMDYNGKLVLVFSHMPSFIRLVGFVYFWFVVFFYLDESMILHFITVKGSTKYFYYFYYEVFFFRDIISPFWFFPRSIFNRFLFSAHERENSSYFHHRFGHGVMFLIIIMKPFIIHDTNSIKGFICGRFGMASMKLRNEKTNNTKAKHCGHGV